MSRTSKGKLKYLWLLYGVKEIIEARRGWTIWFFEPSTEMKAVVESQLIGSCWPDRPNLAEASMLTSGHFGKDWLQTALDDLRKRASDPNWKDEYHMHIPQKIDKEIFGRRTLDGSYYDGCRRLTREHDLEVFHSIAKVDFASYSDIKAARHQVVNHGTIYAQGSMDRLQHEVNSNG